LGSGAGVGAAAVEVGRALGALVFGGLAADGKAGPEHTINVAKRGWHHEVLKLAPEGVDIVFDPVGGDGVWCWVEFTTDLCWPLPDARRGGVRQVFSSGCKIPAPPRRAP